MAEIYFHNEEINFVLPQKKKIRQWIIKSAALESKTAGSLNIIFVSENYLYALNVKHLGHETHTDIITFDYTNENEISGDIFISIERVKENAKELRIPFINELQRIIIHGVLHLAGYKDKSQQEKKIMTAKEDYYLSLLPKIMA